MVEANRSVQTLHLDINMVPATLRRGYERAEPTPISKPARVGQRAGSNPNHQRSDRSMDEATHRLQQSEQLDVSRLLRP
jgi:hypothetical protein